MSDTAAWKIGSFWSRFCWRSMNCFCCSSHFLPLRQHAALPCQFLQLDCRQPLGDDGVVLGIDDEIRAVLARTAPARRTHDVVFLAEPAIESLDHGAERHGVPLGLLFGHCENSFR